MLRLPVVDALQQADELLLQDEEVPNNKRYPFIFISKNISRGTKSIQTCKKTKCIVFTLKNKKGGTLRKKQAYLLLPCFFLSTYLSEIIVDIQQFYVRRNRND